MPSMNLVLGFATNQSAEDLQIFVSSLRRVYSPAECDVVLIVDQPPARGAGDDRPERGSICDYHQHVLKPPITQAQGAERRHPRYQ